MIILFGLMRRSGAIAQRREFDLSETEWRIMAQVGEFAPLSLNGLAELLLLDRGQLCRAVKGMVERGLLSRERKPGGPEIEIDLTRRGREIHGRMVARVVERDRLLIEGIPEGDLDALRRAIDTMIARAETLLDDEREPGSL
jgi:DNA-binding MarR family transcriptional regulator